MTSFPDIVNGLNDRLRAVERQTIPISVAGDGTYGANILEDKPYGIQDRIITQSAAPTLTYPLSYDLGTEWVDSGTGAVQYWDGMQWRSGEFPWFNKHDFTAFLIPILAGGRTGGSFKRQTGAPATPTYGDIWFDLTTTQIKFWNGAAWTVGDADALSWAQQAVLAFGLTDISMFAQSLAPTALHQYDIWADTDDTPWTTRIWDNSWNLVPDARYSSGDVITQPTIQTKHHGNRMIMRDDGSEGVIEFWSGVDGEAHGQINPGVDGSGLHYIDIITSHPTGRTSAKIRMLASSAVANPLVQLLNSSGLDVNGTLNANNGLNVLSGYNLAGGGSINGAFSCNNTITADKYIINNPGSSTSAANLRYNAGGSQEILVTSSLTKHKMFRKKILNEGLKSILKVPLIDWIDRNEYEANGRSKEGLRRIPGTTAEDMEKYAPQFCDYDADGNLIGILYDRIGVALLPLVRELYEKVDKLERRIETLEAGT